jgi:hypothetical protein
VTLRAHVTIKDTVSEICRNLADLPKSDKAAAEHVADFDLTAPAWYVIADDGVGDDVLGILRLARVLAGRREDTGGRVARAHGRAHENAVRMPAHRFDDGGLTRAEVWTLNPQSGMFVHKNYPGAKLTAEEVTARGHVAHRPMSAWGHPRGRDEE